MRTKETRGCDAQRRTVEPSLCVLCVPRSNTYTIEVQVWMGYWWWFILIPFPFVWIVYLIRSLE